MHCPPNGLFIPRVICLSFAVIPDNPMKTACVLGHNRWREQACRLVWLKLQWRHNDRDSVSSHQPHDCLLNHLFRRRSKKASKLCVTGLCGGKSPVTGEFHAQMASNAENVSIGWRHQEKLICSIERTVAIHSIPLKVILNSNRGKDSAVLCAKCKHDWATGADIMEERDFTRFYLKRNFGRVFYIAKPLGVHCFGEQTRTLLMQWNSLAN